MTQNYRQRQHLRAVVTEPEREPVKQPDDVPAWAWALIISGAALLILVLVYFEAFRAQP